MFRNTLAQSALSAKRKLQNKKGAQAKLIAEIRAATKDWIATLDGLVPNETMKQMAERDAWYVLGVKNVVNNVQIKW